MKKLKTGRRAKRSFTPEFRADAVRLVVSGKSATQVAKDLDLTETTLREWVRRAEADAGVRSPTVLMTEERAELARLRRENKQLRMEREILKAAAPSSQRYTSPKKRRAHGASSATRCVRIARRTSRRPPPIFSAGSPPSSPRCCRQNR